MVRRRLATGFAPVLRLAHMLSPRALSFGMTAAISTQPDYTLPQQWAAALHRAGFQAIASTCSHDPTSKTLNVAVFGPAGAPPSVGGWTTRAGPVQSDAALLGELAPYGIRIVPMPHNVPTVPPAF